MRYVTIDQVMRWRPCCAYDRNTVRHLFAGRKRVNAADIFRMRIPAEDRLWAVSHLLTRAQRRRIVAEHPRLFKYTNSVYHSNDSLWYWDLCSFNYHDRIGLRLAVKELTGVDVREELTLD